MRPGLETNEDSALELHRAVLVEGLASVVTLITLAYDSSLIVAGGGIVSNAPWLIPQCKFAWRSVALDLRS